MKQKLIIEAENIAPIAAPLQATNVAETGTLVGENEVTPEEKRTAVLAALKKRDTLEERVNRLRATNVTLMLLLGVFFIFNLYTTYTLMQWNYREREMQQMWKRRIASAERLQNPILSPPNAPATINVPLQLVKISTLKKGQIAYADLETLTSLATGRRPSETFVSLTRPAANPTSIGNTVIGDEPFWKMTKAEQGYNLVAYATASDALAAANGEYAVVYARPIAGGVETPIPFQKLPPYDGILSETTGDNMPITLPGPDRTQIP